MPKRRPTYDPMCYDLAVAFLADEPELDTEDNRDTIANSIQQCIEDEITFLKQGPEDRDG